MTTNAKRYDVIQALSGTGGTMARWRGEQRGVLEQRKTGWRADLSPVVKACPWMKPFVDRWDEFDRLYDACNLDALYLLLRVSGVEAADLRAQGGTQ